MSGSHGHGHGHGHAPVTATAQHRKRLVLVVCITGAVFVAEVIGGLVSGSLALLADAGHMLTDSTGLVIALIATALAARPATSTRTFGWQRAEVLAALVNGLLLSGIAVWVLVLGGPAVEPSGRGGQRLDARRRRARRAREHRRAVDPAWR